MIGWPALAIKKRSPLLSSIDGREDELCAHVVELGLDVDDLCFDPLEPRVERLDVSEVILGSDAVFYCYALFDEGQALKDVLGVLVHLKWYAEVAIA